MLYVSRTMPLAFSSLSHGELAFGFFNIETDMLLLDRLFFFAQPFCHTVVEAQTSAHQARMNAWHIHDRNDIGDLHGAIAGVRLVGFIGETYQKWPFPENHYDFKQNPNGYQNRSLIENMIIRWGRPTTISLCRNPADETVAIGGYVFSNLVFQQLIDYVYLGGYPRWKDGVRPFYVDDMIKTLQNQTKRAP